MPQLRADREEARVEAPGGHRVRGIVHPRPHLDRDPEPDDARDLRVEHVARESIARDAVPHHASERGLRLTEGHGVTGACELVRGREPAGPPPTTRTRLPVDRAGSGSRQCSRSARSPRNLSTAWMETASSSFARLQAISHG